MFDVTVWRSHDIFLFADDISPVWFCRINKLIDDLIVFFINIYSHVLDRFPSIIEREKDDNVILLNFRSIVLFATLVGRNRIGPLDQFAEDRHVSKITDQLNWTKDLLLTLSERSALLGLQRRRLRSLLIIYSAGSARAFLWLISRSASPRSTSLSKTIAIKKTLFCFLFDRRFFSFIDVFLLFRKLDRGWMQREYKSIWNTCSMRMSRLNCTIFGMHSIRPNCARSKI